MTKIQLRRDTAANWSTNNPTPSAGEPCFETDTGKLKIGDGITAYNSLPYQGGTSDTAVTTDTAQTISGEKTFTNDVIVEQWNMTTSPVREAHIDLSGGNGNQFISAEGTDKAFGMYTGSDTGIQLGTSKLDYTKGLSIKPSSLTFKSSDGTVTDLLAGGSGDVTSAGDNTFTGNNTFNKKITTDKGIDSQGTITTTGLLCYGGIGSSDLYLGLPTSGFVPSVKSSQTDKNIVFNGEFKDGMSATKCSWDFVGTGMKIGDSPETLYDVITKSPTNNEYMARMAMPSNKYIDLTLGASGSLYTAPANGWVCASGHVPTANQWGKLRMYATKTAGGVVYSTSSLSNGSSSNSYIDLILPVKKGYTFSLQYIGPMSVDLLRFWYAVGSESEAQ